MGGHLLPLAAADILHEHRGTVPFKGHISEAIAVRRPGRRHQRLLRIEQHPRVETVGVGDAQTVPLLPGGVLSDRDVGDAGIERAAHAGEFFEDDIADAVRDAAQLPAPGLDAEPGQLVCLVHVQQPELDLVVPGLRVFEVADDDVFHAQHLPVAEIDVSEFHRPLRQLVLIHGGEAPASCQVVGDGPVQVDRLLAGRAVPAERDNRDGQRIFDAGIDDDFQFALGLERRRGRQ